MVPSGLHEVAQPGGRLVLERLEAIDVDIEIRFRFKRLGKTPEGAEERAAESRPSTEVWKADTLMSAILPSGEAGKWSSDRGFDTNMVDVAKRGEIVNSNAHSRCWDNTVTHP
jgi:hypothetical protein